MKLDVARAAPFALSALGGGWMLLDGSIALVTGDYVGSELGPWAYLVPLVGVDPLSFGMRLFFVLYGAGWLCAAAWYARWPATGRWALLAFALGSIWYALIGTAVSTALAMFLLTERRQGPRP